MEKGPPDLSLQEGVCLLAEGMAGSWQPPAAAPSESAKSLELRPRSFRAAPGQWVTRGGLLGPCHLCPVGSEWLVGLVETCVVVWGSPCSSLLLPTFPFQGTGRPTGERLFLPTSASSSLVCILRWVVGEGWGGRSPGRITMLSPQLWEMNCRCF